jgi:hypothetical protein
MPACRVPIQCCGKAGLSADRLRHGRIALREIGAADARTPLLLQQWYGLSDPAAEEALVDRLSFRRFCGFPLDQKTPDHMSIWRT